MKNIITILLILILPIIAYLIMNKNSEQIMAVAKENNLPTLMTFSSTMCIDCQKMKKLLNEIEPAYQNKINFVSINALDKDKKVKNYINKFGVTLVPTLVFIDDNGTLINKIEGYIPKEELISEIEEAING